MKIYLQAFINVKQKDWAKFLLIVMFAYNNTKNANTGYMLFKLNYGYYLCVFFKKNTNFCSQLKIIDKLLAKLRESMIVYQENLCCIQEL